MEDLSEKQRSLLSDPESLQNLSELAAMLRHPEDAWHPENARQPEDARQPEETPPDLPPEMPDLGKLMAVGQILSRNGSDDAEQLILALKPHLSEERAERAAKAVKLMHLWRIVSMLRESGMIGELL